MPFFSPEAAAAMASDASCAPRYIGLIEIHDDMPHRPECIISKAHLRELLLVMPSHERKQEDALSHLLSLFLSHPTTSSTLTPACTHRSPRHARHATTSPPDA